MDVVVIKMTNYSQA